MPMARLTIIIDEFKRVLKRLLKMVLILMAEKRYRFAFYSPNLMP